MLVVGRLKENILIDESRWNTKTFFTFVKLGSEICTSTYNELGRFVRKILEIEEIIAIPGRVEWPCIAAPA